MQQSPLAHAGRQDRRVVSAFVTTAFAPEDADSASAQWRQVTDQLRTKAPKLASIMDEAEHDVLAYMTFPAAHRAKLHTRSTASMRSQATHQYRRHLPQRGRHHPADRRDPPRGVDKWAVQRARYMTLESIAPVSDNTIVKLPTVAVSASRPHLPDTATDARLLHNESGHDREEEIRCSTGSIDGA